MQLFLLNKPVIIKGKLHKKSGLQESQKISCMTRFLFVLIQNIHPANSDKKVLLITEDKSEVRLRYEPDHSLFPAARPSQMLSPALRNSVV